MYVEKELKKELIEIKNFLISLIAEMPIGVIALDKSDSITALNARALFLLGEDSSINELLDKNVVGALRNRDLKTFFKENLHNEKEVRSGEIQARVNEYGPVWISVVVKPIAKGALVLVEDVSEAKMLKDMKDEFVSLASHQLRTPLSGTKWTLELFMEDKSLTEKQKERLNDVYASNQRLIDLVNQLLNVARIETGKLPVNKKMVNIVELVNNSCKSLQPNADKKKQKINISIEAEVKETSIDPMLFGETVNNIVSNSINYGPENSVIDVTVSAKDANYVVAIHNTGPAIPKADQEKLFQKFQRGVDAQNQKTNGSGLGLFFAKKAVEINGGTIWVESNADTSTTFYFTVPIK